MKENGRIKPIFGWRLRSSTKTLFIQSMLSRALWLAFHSHSSVFPSGLATREESTVPVCFTKHSEKNRSFSDENELLISENSQHRVRFQQGLCNHIFSTVVRFKERLGQNSQHRFLIVCLVKQTHLMIQFRLRKELMIQFCLRTKESGISPGKIKACIRSGFSKVSA